MDVERVEPVVVADLTEANRERPGLYSAVCDFLGIPYEADGRDIVSKTFDSLAARGWRVSHRPDATAHDVKACLSDAMLRFGAGDMTVAIEPDFMLDHVVYRPTIFGPGGSIPIDPFCDDDLAEVCAETEGYVALIGGWRMFDD